MIAEIGHLSLIIAFVMALSQSILPLWGAQAGNLTWMKLARPAAWGQFIFMALAYGCLTAVFVLHDFSVLLAAEHSNSRLPLVYRITAVWGNHEGSILLWTLILSGWTLAVALKSRALDDAMVARILGVMGLVSCGFLVFTLWASNPFLRLIPAAADGNDLNPLLQDPGMILHPPMLYMGYVGFVVAFAFAIAALLAGKLDSAWARWSRPWTSLAWCFLTLGIALGSFWAYYELGWGGWWFWDPVENASFMPWLAGTALMHSLAVTEKRGGFKNWTALLAIVTFSLSLMGTFLVRSGVLSSVHAFATDPTRGLFILVLLAVVVGGSLFLFAWRAPKVRPGGSFELISRESMLLTNNVLLMVATASVLLGTLYPLIIDALGMGKLSVGPPYFEAVFIPLMAPALFLMGIGPMARWQRADPIDLWRRLRWAAGVSFATALLTPLVLGKWSPWVALGILQGVWLIASAVYQLIERLRSHPSGRWLHGLRAQAGSYYGMLLAHTGVGVFILGVTVVGGYASETDVRMEPGQTASIGGYHFKLEGVDPVTGPNYTATKARLTVTQGDRWVALLTPERRIYHVRRSPMTEVGIDRGLFRDLYAALGEPVGPQAWSIRLHHKPLINWIWLGCVLMALGGIQAVLDRKYRFQPRTPLGLLPQEKPGSETLVQPPMTPSVKALP
ncbi:MAG: heme lyase CcmF/NrfE family subunit [Burkholderiales bacterium]